MSEVCENQELTITVPSEIVAREYNLTVKKIQQKASRPGFRPGKMPEAMIKQFYNHEINQTVLDKLIEDSFDKECAEKKIRPVSQAKTELVGEFKPNQELVYKASFQVMPELDIKNYENLNIELKNIIFSEQDINEELEYLRENQAMFVSPERTEISACDLVECDSEVLIEGVLDNNYSHKDYSVPLFAPNVPENLKTALIGKKVGDIASVMYTMPEDHQDEIIKGKECEMKLSIKAFKERVLPELSDDFAKDLSDKFTSLEDIRESINLRLTITANRRRDYHNQNAIIEALINNNSFDVPSSMIDRATYALLERQLSSMDKQAAQKMAQEHWNEMWQSLRPRAVFKVKADLIFDNLMNKLDIQASDEEVDYRVKNSKDLEPEDASWQIRVEKLLDIVKKSSNITTVDELLYPKSEDNV